MAVHLLLSAMAQYSTFKVEDAPRGAFSDSIALMQGGHNHKSLETLAWG